MFRLLKQQVLHSYRPLKDNYHAKMVIYHFLLLPHWTNSPPKTPPETESSQTHIDRDLTRLPTHLLYCHYNCFEVTISTFQENLPREFLLVHLGWIFCDVKEPGKPSNVNLPKEYITSYRAFCFGPIWRNCSLPFDTCIYSVRLS